MSHDPSSLECVHYTIRDLANPLQDVSDIAEDIMYCITPASLVTDATWGVSAATFSAHYGVCSARAMSEHGAWALPGKNIVVTPRRLKEQLLPEGANNTFITVVTRVG